MKKVIKKFKFNQLIKHPKKFYRGPTSLAKNCDDFVDWIMKVLTEEEPILIKGNSYNANCIYMNKKNIDKISSHLSPMASLNYSPNIDDSLKDDEFAIDLESIFKKAN